MYCILLSPLSAHGIINDTSHFDVYTACLLRCKRQGGAFWFVHQHYAHTLVETQMLHHNCVLHGLTLWMRAVWGRGWMQGANEVARDSGRSYGIHVDKSWAAGRLPESNQDLFGFEFVTSPEEKQSRNIVSTFASSAEMLVFFDSFDIFNKTWVVRIPRLKEDKF